MHCRSLGRSALARVLAMTKHFTSNIPSCDKMHSKKGGKIAMSERAFSRGGGVDRLDLADGLPAN